MNKSKKVVLSGYYGVGKTSLINQYVHKSFSEEYLTTIGVKIEKKVVDVDGDNMTMMIWDIAGESTSVKTPQSYKSGAHGIIYVFDVTRPVTYQNLENELLNLEVVLPNVPISIVGNKSDLLDENSLEQIQLDLGLKRKCTFTSALSGDNVEELFLQLAKSMINGTK